MNALQRTAVLGLLAATAAARAADTPDLSQLVTDHTFFVARVDLMQIKLPAAVRWAQQMLIGGKMPLDDVNEIIRPMAAGAMLAQGRIDGATKAGITQAAVVVNFGENGFREEPLFMVVVAGADPDAVASALKGVPFTATEVGDLTVWTPTPQAAQIVKLTPSPRPDLIDAVAKPEGTAVLAAWGVPEAQRAKIAKTWPGNGPVMDQPGPVSLFDNVKRMTLRVDAGQPHATLTADTKSADAALAWLHDADAVKPDGREQAMWATIKKGIVAALPITSAGQVLTIEMRQPEMQKLASALTPAMSQARKSADRIKSASNQRSLLMACMLYANDNRGATPPNLDALRKYAGRGNGTRPAAILLTNPQRPELGAAGYVFVPAVEGTLSKVKNAANRLAIYEAGDFGEGVNVGYWDGHVEFVADKARFDAELAAAGVAPAK